MKNNSKIIVRRRLIRSYVTSVISIALVLFLAASAVVFVANARNISRYFKENMSVSVILKQSTLEKEARALAADLTKLDYVRDGRFISKEEGAKEMEVLLGEDFLDVFESSPIPMSVDLHLNGDAITTDSLKIIKGKLLENPLVEDVVYQENLIEALNTNLQKISLVLSVIIVLLMIISFALISNTVRLNIYARRFTIHTMSLVGAKRSFIARPFVIQAVVEGAVAGVMACGVIVAAMYSLSRDSEVLNAIFDKQIVALSLVGTLILGIVICVLSTLFVVNKVAYISKDNLYY